jgi:hypothetical protein
LHSRQTRGPVYGYSGSCSASRDDSGIDIIDRIDTDVEMSLPDFRGSCKHDEGQVTRNAGDDDGGHTGRDAANAEWAGGSRFMYDNIACLIML